MTARERIVEAFWEDSNMGTGTAESYMVLVDAAIAEAVSAETERCAGIADFEYKSSGSPAAWAIRDAIRSTAQPEVSAAGWVPALCSRCGVEYPGNERCPTPGCAPVILRCTGCGHYPPNSDGDLIHRINHMFCGELVPAASWNPIGSDPTGEP